MEATPKETKKVKGWTWSMIDHLSYIAPLLLPSYSSRLGRHLVAKTEIKMGTILCEEEVLIILCMPGIDEGTLLKHRDKIRQACPFFDNLHPKSTHFPKSTTIKSQYDNDCLVVKRIETNGFDAGSFNSFSTIGLSLFVSMASHACDPSACYGVGTWPSSENKNLLRAIAVKDLKAGEEVTIRYGRCEEMLVGYGFECSCIGSCLDGTITTLQEEFIKSLHSNPLQGEMIGMF